jgi:Coenzyme PQQ synthesis protein D (PqqD)
MSTQYPLARKDKLVVRELEDETLVYDLTRNKALCLNRTAAAVWKSSNGQKDAAQIADELSIEFGATVEEKMVWSAIDQLGRDHLLEYCIPVPANQSVVTRRKQLKYMARAAAAVPVVAVLTAPRASAAQSCRPANAACTPGGIPCCNHMACMKNGAAYKCKA